jgi:hypothetical protein
VRVHETGVTSEDCLALVADVKERDVGIYTRHHCMQVRNHSGMIFCHFLSSEGFIALAGFADCRKHQIRDDEGTAEGEERGYEHFRQFLELRLILLACGLKNGIRHW